MSIWPVLKANSSISSWSDLDDLYDCFVNFVLSFVFDLFDFFFFDMAMQSSRPVGLVVVIHVMRGMIRLL